MDILIDEQINFTETWEHRVEYQAGNVIVPTASIDDLILMKQRSAPDKDLSDIAALNQIKALRGKEK